MPRLIQILTTHTIKIPIAIAARQSTTEMAVNVEK